MVDRMERAGGGAVALRFKYLIFDTQSTMEVIYILYHFKVNFQLSLTRFTSCFTCHSCMVALIGWEGGFLHGA